MQHFFSKPTNSDAVWGHPRWMGLSGEGQNVVLWRREWQTTSVFLPWESHEQYEKAKNRTLKDEPPRSVGAQYAKRWVAFLTQWTWIWVDSGSWCWTGRPGMLQFMGLQSIGPDWMTELNWTQILISQC